MYESLGDLKSITLPCSSRCVFREDTSIRNSKKHQLERAQKGSTMPTARSGAWWPRALIETTGQGERLCFFPDTRVYMVNIDKDRDRVERGRGVKTAYWTLHRRAR